MNRYNLKIMQREMKGCIRNNILNGRRPRLEVAGGPAIGTKWWWKIIKRILTDFYV